MTDHTNDYFQSGTKERLTKGKEKRKLSPRSAHGDWTPAPDRPDPISLLQAQDAGRLQHLLPIKYGRMMASPFSFFRGSAVVMASDLATTKRHEKFIRRGQIRCRGTQDISARM